MNPQKFQPKQDITTYELALAVDWMNSAMYSALTRSNANWEQVEQRFHEFPEGVKRHFVEVVQDGNTWKPVVPS